MSYGDASGVKPARMALPAVRMAVVAVRRTPPTATAVAPDAHRVLTTAATSRSITRPATGASRSVEPAAEAGPVVVPLEAGASVISTVTPGPVTAVNPAARSSDASRSAES